MNAQTRLALKVGLATALSTFLALWFHLKDPYWSGVSAFLICVDSIDNSFIKMLQRIGCTLLGAVFGVLAVHFFMETPVLLVVVAFFAMVLCVYRGFQSHNWYVWLFTTITFFMVVSAAMIGSTSLDTLNIALYRSLNIILGSVTGFVVAWFFSNTSSSLLQPKKGKRFKIEINLQEHWVRFKQNRYYWLFGVKVALCMIAFPLLWAQFNLPGATQIAVSIGAVLNIDFIATQKKSNMRVLGCFLGAVCAVIALIVLRVETLSFLLILVFLMAFACSYFHNSTSSFSYAGTQAIVAFLMGVVIDFQPSIIPDPSIERLVNIMGGVLLLHVVLNYLWPFSKSAQIKHYQGQLRQRISDLQQIIAGCLTDSSYDLMASVEKDHALLKRDMAQLSKLGVTLSSEQLDLIQTLEKSFISI